MTAPIRLNIAVVYCIHKYKVENAGQFSSIIYIYISRSWVQQTILQNDRTPAAIIRFSEFFGIGYFGDKKQRVIAPIFDLRYNAERGWEKIMANQQQQEVPIFHIIFVELAARYEFIAHPIEMSSERINYVLYRSSSGLSSLNKFKSDYGSAMTYIKFGWHDLTKPHKFDVLPYYAAVDSIEFKKAEDIKPGMLVDQIRKS
jgi:hypothetical protein